MGQLFDIVTRHLEADEWNYETIPDTTIARCGVKAKNASYRIIIQTLEEQLQTVVYVVYPNAVPEGMRAIIAEFATRANYGMRIGNFELDMDDGELRYKVSVDVEGSSLTERAVELMISAAVSTADRYYPGVMNVLFGGASAVNAIALIENGSESPSAGGMVN